MRVFFFFFAAASLLFLGAACTKESTTTNTTTTNTVETTNVNTAQAADGNVTVTSSGFSPRSITVQKGVAVTWTNESGRTAYIAPDNHPSHTKYRGTWDDDGSGSVQNGETYSFTFETAGTYTYHDHLNSSRTGTVIVTE